MTSIWDLDEPSRRAALSRLPAQRARARLEALGIEPNPPPPPAEPPPDSREHHVRRKREATSCKEILYETAASYGLRPEQILAQDRSAEIVKVRHEIAWRPYHQGRRWDQERPSLPEIARLLGGRDHTTVIHAIRRYQARLDAGEAQP